MIQYYIYKIKNKILSKIIFWRFGFKSKRGVFWGSFGKFNFENKIIFAFWDSKLIHLGDQLFYQPVMERLIKNYEVYICGDTALSKYFSALGAKSISSEELRGVKGAIFISKDDLAFQTFQYFNKGNYFIGMNYAAMEDEKIVVSIAGQIFKILSEIGIIKNQKNSLDFFDIHIKIPDLIKGEKEKFKDIKGRDDKFFIFNNYVASDFVGTIKRRDLLENLAKEKKNKGYKIIHIGSEAEENKDKEIYDFVDLDLRGKLLPMDLFELFSLAEVLGVISYDTFPMHVASLYGKDLHVVIRKKERRDEYIKKFIPMYPGIQKILKKCL